MAGCRCRRIGTISSRCSSCAPRNCSLQQPGLRPVKGDALSCSLQRASRGFYRRLNGEIGFLLGTVTRRGPGHLAAEIIPPTRSNWRHLTVSLVPSPLPEPAHRRKFRDLLRKIAEPLGLFGGEGGI